jgi:signal peptidase I
VWVPIATVVGLVVVVAILRLTDLVVPVLARPGASNVPTIPACNGRYLAEGFTYRFRDPHRGEMVVIHARVDLGGTITPDPHARDLNLTKRVIGVPGDTVVGRGERVFVNGRKADDIATAPFPATRLGPKQYFVLGDNRSESRTAASSGLCHAPRSSAASSSSTGRSDDSARPATTRNSYRRERSPAEPTRGSRVTAAEVEHAGAVERVPTSELLEHGVVATRPPTHVVGDVPQAHGGEANRPCWRPSVVTPAISEHHQRTTHRSGGRREMLNGRSRSIASI